MKPILPHILAGMAEALDRVAADQALLQKVQLANEWFTPGLVRDALAALRPWFTAPRLTRFAAAYPPAERRLRVGIIMAGNLPLVGLHDLLCVLLSGHAAEVKLSSKDALLLPALLRELDAELPVRFHVQLDPREIDYLLATGSDNTARYLEHSYANVPRIVRHNRFSVAVVTGQESSADLDGLARDVLCYHGMGCRSVSSVLAPPGYDPGPLAAALDRFPVRDLAPAWQEIQRWEAALAQMATDRPPWSRNVTLQAQTGLVPARIGVLHLVHSTEPAVLLAEAQDKLQCVVGQGQPIAFGQAQCPELEEFADGVDVMAALADQASS